MTQEEVTECLQSNRDRLLPHELAYLMVELLGQPLSHGLLARQFRFAFGIPVRTLLELGQWSGVGGEWTDDEFNQALREWLLNKESKPNGDDHYTPR